MAGLLDMLGGLTPEQNQGLLAAAAQMLQASGSPKPVSLGAAAGMGLQTYQGTMEQNRVRKLDEQRQAQNDQFQQEYRTVQMDGIKSQKNEREAKLKFEQARQEAVRRAIKPDGTLDNQALIANLAPFDPEGAMQIAKDLAPKPVTYGTNPEAWKINGKERAVVIGSDGSRKVYEDMEPVQKQFAPRGAGGGAARGASGAIDKPLPTSALKMLVSEEDALATASGIQQELGRVKQQITDGKLTFGLASNALNTARNFIGNSNEESRNFASFRATLEKLRNDSLRLNAGVQTDGDAKRAWNELFANINDKEYVSQRLAEIEKINERAIAQRQANISTIQGNYSKPAAANQTQTRAKNPPMKGQVKNGYRYIGGEPSDPASWEKI